MSQSNWLSPEAERALGGDEEASRRIYIEQYTSQASYYPPTATISPQPIVTYATTEPTYSAPQNWITHSLYSQDPSPSYPTSSPPTSNFPTLEPVISNASSNYLPPDNSQQHTSGSSGSCSPNPSDLHNYGFPNSDGTWRCGYPGCSSKSIFTRGCDLRKHFNRHTKSLFCRHDGCPQSTDGGFSSKKDRARHEAKHNPGVVCEWEGCNRVFSRVDNMKDHVRRIHRKSSIGS